MHDFKVDGMLHGRVVRPPAVGAKLVAVDEASIKAIPGARVVRINDFLGVVADDEWDADRRRAEAEGALVGRARADRQRRACAAWMRAGPFEADETLVQKGDARQALAGAAKRVAAEYYWPMQSHALDGAVVRGRRRARRQGDDLDRVAGDAPLPRDDRARARRCRTTPCASSISTAPAATG